MKFKRLFHFNKGNEVQSGRGMIGDAMGAQPISWDMAYVFCESKVVDVSSHTTLGAIGFLFC